MNRTRNLIIIAVVLVAVIAIAAFSTKRGGDAVSVRTVTAKRTSFQTKLPESGVVQAPQVVTVPTLVAGNIAHIYARAGERVSAGQLLATIENPSLESTAAGSQADYDSAVANVQTAKIQEQNAKVTYRGQVETAKSSLDEARRIYQADAALYASKAIPRNQLDEDKTKLDQAQVQYEQALRQLHLGAVTGYGTNSVQYAQAAAQKAQIINASNQQQLGFTRIVAPFDGVIQTIASQPNDPLTNVREGDAVTQGQALFTIAASTHYIVKAQVDEQDIINVRPGQAADISSEDFPGKTLAGHVMTIAPLAIRSTDASTTARQVLTTIQLENAPSYLKDGMSVDVDIVTKNLRNVVTVPGSAIVREGGKPYVYVMIGGKAHKRAVKLGESSDTQTVVLSGVHAGDRVIADKDPMLHDGAPVVAQSPSATASPGA
ncbi:MAG TPA: efflux RND transporter periplasmic adaptor subunit [Candidatus Baltobacteraceae bacterium]|nr:efflux RND transporter periplasmic adaptor subunit [Candidatus Baltobacteraceae bacterium]